MLDTGKKVNGILTRHPCSAVDEPSISHILARLFAYDHSGV
jgi:hypothetical protein